MVELPCYYLILSFIVRISWEATEKDSSFAFSGSSQLSRGNLLAQLLLPASANTAEQLDANQLGFLSGISGSQRTALHSPNTVGDPAS